MGILQAIILKWVAMPSSRGSSQRDPQRDQIQVSHIIGRFFTVQATRETQLYIEFKELKFIPHDGLPSGTSGKEPTANAGDIRDGSLIPGAGRSSGGGHSNPLQYSCLKNPIDKGTRRATVHSIAKS